MNDEERKKAVAGVDQNEKILSLRKFIAGSGAGGWDQAWKAEVTPWDNGKPQGGLVEALGLPVVLDALPSVGRALIPGCGRAYEAVHIASQLKYTTVGIDLSPIAVKAAQEYFKISPDADSLDVSFLSTDFFKYTVDEGNRFDIIYDYTFFCAIPPALRTQWGTQMQTLIKPGGVLVCIAYPIDGAREGGPPFSVDVKSYEEVLGNGWEKVVDKVPDDEVANDVGRKRLIVWRRGLLENLK